MERRPRGTRDSRCYSQEPILRNGAQAGQPMPAVLTVQRIAPWKATR